MLTLSPLTRPASLTPIKNEVTLTQIAQIAHDPSPLPHLLLFTVIVDIKTTFSQKMGKQYLTKLKVIDPSFHYKTKTDAPGLKFNKFAHVYIFTETFGEAPKIKEVGDILRLRRFMFKIGNSGDLVGKEVKFSNWLVYHKNSTVSESYKDFQKNKNRPLNDYEARRLKQMRNFVYDFFAQNSLMYVLWWKNLPNEKNISKILQQNENEKGNFKFTNVDIIL